MTTDAIQLYLTPLIMLFLYANSNPRCIQYPNTQLTTVRIVAAYRLRYLLRHSPPTFKPLVSTHPSQTGRVYLYSWVTLGFHPSQAGLVQEVSCKNGHTAYAAPLTYVVI